MTHVHMHTTLLIIIKICVFPCARVEEGVGGGERCGVGVRVV